MALYGWALEGFLMLEFQRKRVVATQACIGLAAP